jgi:aminopeptidase N
MFKNRYNLFLISLTVTYTICCTFCLAQKSETLKHFYELEQQTWQSHVFRAADFEEPTNFDVTFYHLDIDVRIDTPFISGNVLCRFRSNENGLSSIHLSLQYALIITDIAGNAASFEQTGDTVYIELDRTYSIDEYAEIQIYYQGVPALAGNVKGLNYRSHASGEPLIASLSTPFLAHYWWPCKDGPGDKPDSVYIDITIPDTTINGIPLIAVSNGVLEHTSLAENKRTFHWRHRYPIIPYYVMVAISNYRTFHS